MVYMLRHIKTGETVVMGVNNKYTLGRSRINSILLRDLSCSHKHAVIQIKDGYATIMDLVSKRGTYVNDQKIFDETRLKHADLIRFGLNNCKYSFIDPKFQTVIASTVPSNTKNALQEALISLNVTLTEKYSNECTHFTSGCVSLDMLKTTRILDALVDQKPIVKPGFWISMFNNLQEAVEIPNIYRYMPDIEDALTAKGVQAVVSSKKRQALFKEKLFIFFDKSLEKRMEHLIWKCGGGTIQHNGSASFAMTLMKEKNFDCSVIVRGIQEEPSLTVTYFIDKLRQCDKNVLELSEDDIYVIIVKGYLEDTAENKRENEKPQAADKNTKPVNSGPSTIDNSSDDHEDCSKTGMSANQTETSRSLKNKPIVKNKTIKPQRTVLSKWVRTTKKRRTIQNQTTRPESNNEMLDTSLSMSSDDSSEEKLNKKEGNQVCPAISSDESEREEQLKLASIQSRHKTAQHASSHVVVVEDSNSEERNSSASHRRTERKEKQSSKQVKSSRDANKEASMDNFDIQRKTRPRRSKKKNKIDHVEITKGKTLAKTIFEGPRNKEIQFELQQSLNPLTSHDGTAKVEVSEKHKQDLLQNKNSQTRLNDVKSKCLEGVSSETRSKVEKTKLKINPLAKFKNSSTPKKNAVNDVSLNKNFENSKSNAFKCFLHCLLTKYSWMDEDAGFLLRDIRETLQQSDVEILSLAYILYVCTSVKSMNRCQRAYLFTECFWNKMEEQQPNADEFFYNVDQEK